MTKDEKVYLYVPFGYNDIVKQYGAKFDGNVKKWYVIRSKETQRLIDSYHDSNFYSNFSGTHFKNEEYCTTEKQRESQKAKQTKLSTRYYYQEADKIYSITDNDDTIVKETIKDKEHNKYNYFELQKDYECTLESLKQYREDFNRWCDEIKEDIDYKSCYGHGYAVKRVFNSKSTNIIKSLDLDVINYTEFYFYERCANSGLMSFDEAYKDIEIDCYGYDYSAFYPNNLLKIYVPTKKGNRKKFKSIDYENLQFGIYHVKITSDDKRFNKIFMFSRHNYYTHYSINFAYKYKDEFNIKLELIIDGNYNALVYSDDCLVKGKEIFGDWFNHLQKLKTKYPKNKLIKRLFSSLWGSLCSYDKTYFENDEIDDKDVSEYDDEAKTTYKLLEEKIYDDDSEIGYRTVYHCVNSDVPYKYDLARLKPFLVSYCRAFVGKMIMKENILDNVIRIHTDGIVLNKTYDFTHLKYYPKPEDKTTGKIIWYDVIFNNLNKNKNKKK